MDKLRDCVLCFQGFLISIIIIINATCHWWSHRTSCRWSTQIQKKTIRYSVSGCFIDAGHMIEMDILYFFCFSFSILRKNTMPHKSYLSTITDADSQNGKITLRRVGWHHKPNQAIPMRVRRRRWQRPYREGDWNVLFVNYANLKRKQSHGFALHGLCSLRFFSPRKYVFFLLDISIFLFRLLIFVKIFLLSLGFWSGLTWCQFFVKKKMNAPICLNKVFHYLCNARHTKSAWTPR